MAIIATPGDPTANSYGTLAEANAYFANHPDLETWDDSTDQEEALLFAALQMDAQYDWIGQRATDTQSMEWPRIADDVYTAPRWKWTSTEIPEQLKKVQFETAIIRLLAAASGTSGDEQPLSSLKIGNAVEAKFADSGSASSATTNEMRLAHHLHGLRLLAVLA